MVPSDRRASVFRFDDFELDLGSQELRGPRGVIPLQEKPFLLLQLLLENAGRATTRDEIRDRLWGPHLHISFDDSLNHAVKKLREALNDPAERPRIIQTVPRRGYRFLARMEARTYRQTNHYVGRTAELTELRLAFEAAVEGRGCLICLSGEPGIGKTALAETFLREVSQSRGHVLAGRCSEQLAGIEPYLPILEGLENLLRFDVENAVTNLMRESAPSWWAEVRPDGTSVAADTRLASQERRKREITSFLGALGRTGPIVFFIDDLHWADVSTVDLLSYIGSRCGSMNVLMLGSYRPSDLALSNHPFGIVKLELQAHHLCREIPLSRLAADEVRDYLTLEFSPNQIPDDFASSIHGRTEGAPLFVVDLLRDLKHNGVIANRDGCWILAGALTDIRCDLPDSIAAMVQRKLGKLPEREHRLLEAACVQGLEFQSAVLTSVLGWAAVEVEELLESLERMHCLVRLSAQEDLPDGTFSLRYTFSHSLYQNFFYHRLLPSRRIALSESVAGSLLKHFQGCTEVIASQLGQLYESARDWIHAAEFLTKAASNAAKLSAHREAVKLGESAIANAEKLSGTEREKRILDAALQLGYSRQAMSQFEQSIQDFERAAQSAGNLGDVEAQIGAICLQGFDAGYLKRTDEMRRLGERAFAIAANSGASAALAEAVLAYERLFCGDLVSARAHLGRALPVLHKEGGPVHAAGLAAGVLAMVQFFRAEYKEAESVLASAIQRETSFGTCSNLLRIIWIRGMVQANQGRISDALETLKSGMQLAELNGDSYWYSRFPNTIGWINREMMDLPAAVESNCAGVLAGRQAETPEAEANSHINLVGAYMALGDKTRAWEHLEEGGRLLNSQKHQHWLRWRFNIRFELERANYYFATGDLPAARNAAERALLLARNGSARKHVARALLMLSDIARIEERSDDAVRNAKRALIILQRYPCPMIEWRAALSAAGAAAMAGEQQSSEEFTHQCLEVRRRLADSIRDERLRETFLRSQDVVPISGHNKQRRASF